MFQLFSECRRADRGCILFIRDVIDVWRALSAGSGASLLLQLWRSRAAGEATLMLATAPADVELPVQVGIYRDRQTRTHNYCLYIQSRVPLWSLV